MAGQEWGGRQEGDPIREQKPQSLIRAGVAEGADGTLLAVYLLRIPPAALDGGAPSTHHGATCALLRVSVLGSPQGCPPETGEGGGSVGRCIGAACPHEEVRLTLGAVGTVTGVWGLSSGPWKSEVGQAGAIREGTAEEAEMGTPQGHAYWGASEEKLSEKAPCHGTNGRNSHHSFPFHPCLDRYTQWDYEVCPQPVLELEAHPHKQMPGLEDMGRVEAQSCPRPLLVFTDTAHPHTRSRELLLAPNG